MITGISILAGILAVIAGRCLSSRPALFDTPRLPVGMRFTGTEMQAVGTVLRFGGCAALIGVIASAVVRAVA